MVESLHIYIYIYVYVYIYIFFFFFWGGFKLKSMYLLEMPCYLNHTFSPFVLGYFLGRVSVLSWVSLGQWSSYLAGIAWLQDCRHVSPCVAHLLRWDLSSFLPMLDLNHSAPDLCRLTILDCQHSLDKFLVFISVFYSILQTCRVGLLIVCQRSWILWS
jgi:hypothetical protein